MGKKVFSTNATGKPGYALGEGVRGELSLMPHTWLIDINEK